MRWFQLISVFARALCAFHVLCARKCGAQKMLEKRIDKIHWVNQFQLIEMCQWDIINFINMFIVVIGSVCQRQPSDGAHSLPKRGGATTLFVTSLQKSNMATATAATASRHWKLIHMGRIEFSALHSNSVSNSATLCRAHNRNIIDKTNNNSSSSKKVNK